MPIGNNNILKYSQGERSLGMLFIFFAAQNRYLKIYPHMERF